MWITGYCASVVEKNRLRMIEQGSDTLFHAVLNSTLHRIAVVPDDGRIVTVDSQIGQTNRLAPRSFVAALVERPLPARLREGAPTIGQAGPCI